MSQAVEDWKEGLSSRVLQKIRELESQVDKLKKERQQRQFQLESLEAALQKQKQKVENKNEAATLKRENQSFMELCDSLEKAKQKMSHDLQVKESQVNIQSGQLNSSKKDIERCQQELKRYKCELERSQQTLIAGDLAFSGTPQKSFTAPLTPVQSHNDAKFEELEEKYKKEVQERKKLELELRTIQVKKINQPQPQSSLSHREIARHQASSSVFSWQQEKTPSRNQETPARGSSATSSFPWEKEANSSVISEKNEFDNSFAENCGSSLMIQLRAQNQELNSTVKDLEQQLQTQEKEKKSHMNKHQETELQLERMKLELTQKDKVLNKTRDKLTQIRMQLDQATTQELSCQQRSLQTLDQTCNQIRNKLNQELQQAKNDFNALQAEFDKVMSVKQHLECDTSDLTQKLCRAEQALLAAQATETDLIRRLEEVKQEKNLCDCQLEKMQEIHQLEEELNMIKQSLKQSQNFAEEMKNKNTCQEAQLKLLEEKCKKQESSLSLERLKIALADMEKKQDSTQDLLKEKENHIKEQNCKISKMEEESEALQKLIGFKQRECEELQKEATAFSQWKNENYNLINKLRSEKEVMLTRINGLESALQSQKIKNNEYSEKLRVMETESDRKSAEIREFKDMLQCKSAELEEQKKAFDELQQKAECSVKKYFKEIENTSCKIFQLDNQVGELKEKLHLSAGEGFQREQYYHDLLGEYEKICGLVKAKDTSEMTEDGKVNLQSGQDKTVLGNIQLAGNNSIAEDHRCTRARLLVEAGKTKDLAILQDQVSSLEISVVAQKQLHSDQHQQYEDLPQIKGETEGRLFNVEQMHESFVAETKQHISNLEADISARQKLVEKTLAILEDKDMQLQTLNERVEIRQAELQDLKNNNKLFEDSVRQLKLLSGTWDSEKNMASIFCSYSKKIEELTEENTTLRDLSRTLEQEITLLEANKNISNSLKELEVFASKSNLESRIEELQMLCQTYEKAIKVLEDQFDIQENMKNEEIQELKKVILSERKEIDHLKQQNLSDKEEWQQKLNNLTREMECKSANLSLELETARFQLQVLDLSSYSLLCTDIENNTEEENNLQLPIANSALKSNKSKPTPVEKMSVGDTSVCKNVTETAEARLMEDYTEISGEHECRNTSGKLTSPSNHASALSFSNSCMFLRAGDFFENQITTEMLQEEAKQQTAENLNMICETEESHKHIDLLMKVEQLNSEVNLKNAHLTLKSPAFAELKEATVVVKEENCDIKEKLDSVSVNKQQLSPGVVSLEKELGKVKSELEIYKVRLSNAADTLDDVEMAERGCDEQFLAAENEQRRPKSEQVNIENHAMFTENDLEMLQAKCQQLEREREVNPKTVSSFQEHLFSVTAERNCIGQELSVLSENKKELYQKYQKLQEKLKELESTKLDSTEFIEVRTQTNLLEAAKSDVNQLSNEKDHLLQKLQSLEKDAMSFTLEKEQLQKAADLNKEKELLVRELEMMQSKLSSSETEKLNLSRYLEGMLMQKGELAARLRSAQKEVDQMRYGIEKLKVNIESDEKKKRHVAEKLKHSEWKADSLLDKIERLERELEMSEKNLEDAILQSETAKAEAETLTMEMEEMAEKLKCFNSQIDVLTSQKECLAKDLKEKQERILELESSNLTTAKLLEEKEEEKMQIKDEFENTVVLLKSELKDLREKLEFSCRKEADARAKEQALINQVVHLEQDKKLLLQECQEIKDENVKLDQTREVLVQELMDCKQKLDENMQQNGALQKQVKETEELSLQLTHMEYEHECCQQEKKSLQNLIAELNLKEQHFSDNETFPDILSILKVSYKDLEKELEFTLCENSTLKVNELTEGHTELQVQLSDTEQKISKLQEEFTTERNKLAEEIQLIQEHSEKNKIQLHLTMSEKNELTKSLEMVQKELQEKESEMKREISEYKDRLLQAEKDHRDALTEANRKNEVEIEACQDKMTSLEYFISSQKLEIEHLKSNKELNNSLKEANQTLGELLKSKAENINIIVQLKKETELAESKVQLMKSCKQMEQEKETLQKQLAERDELLKKKNRSMSKREGADENAIPEEIRLKLEELQEPIEVKTREANENLEKYCSLLVKYDKLEEANEMLEIQVSLLSAQLKQPTSSAVSSPLLNSDNSVAVSNQSIKQMRSDKDTTKLSGKRQRCEDNRKDNGEPKSPVPETSSKKKRKDDICQNLLGQKNTDDEPDGLPEVVKKGFADIPTGKVSPSVLRRTTWNLRTRPHLASSSKKLPLPTQDVQKCKPDNLGECSCSTAGGSKPQKVNDDQQSQAVAAFPPVKSTPRSPLCPYKQSMKSVSNSRKSRMTDKAKNSLNGQGVSEQDEQKGNCKVQ
ncbi:LOW QUALITY PROTEIN: centromere protein F [Pterocles gutturalis]